MRPKSDDIALVEGDNELNVEMVPIFVPQPSVSVDFKRERVCMTSRGDECLEYSPDERTGFITITNGDVPGNFTTTVEGWLYLEGAEHSPISGANREWKDYFDAGQERTYSFGYMVPETGMPIDSRFFIKVYDPDSKIIADKVFITSL